MGKIILVCGGSRSGKSGYAQTRAELLSNSKLFIATCPQIDTEMDQRIKKHLLDRRGKGWETIEEQLDLAKAVGYNADFDVILVDCLTLWINNLLYEQRGKEKKLDEGNIQSHCSRILDAARNHPGTIIFVTNEVGSGIIPDAPETRLYRDLVGRCNQCFGVAADEVILVVCGVPLVIKTYVEK